MNVYYKKGLKFNRQNKTLIDCYGSYGINLDQGFNIVNLSAMERGWIIAQAFVRGGGEKGMRWHEDGKLLKKPNSIKDLVACTEYLIMKKFTHPNLIGARGSSAGGMLVAQTCLNLYPELYRACILNVPFLDTLTTLLDDSLALTVTDHLEFGNPIENEKDYRMIHSLSPYENLTSKEYPACFIRIS